MSKIAMKKPAKKVARKAAAPETVVINKPPTETQHGWRWTVTLSKRLKPKVEALAKAFGMTPRGFLHAYYLRQLPGQLPADPPRCTIAPDKLNVICGDPEALPRIKRAAAAAGKTVDKFVATSIESSVRGYEQDMILHPKTGEVIGDELWLDPHSLHPDIKLEIGAHSHQLSRAVAEEKKGREELLHYSHHDPDYEGKLYRVVKGRYEVDDDANGQGQRLDPAGVVAFFIERNIPQEYRGEFAAFLPRGAQAKTRSLSVPLCADAQAVLSDWAQEWNVKPVHIAQPIVEQCLFDAKKDETLKASLQMDAQRLRAGKRPVCY